MKPGLKVTPNVQLREQLGQGAMGSVWRADQLALDTEVVVKFILPHHHQDQKDAVTRFRREASTAAKLSSPHVVRVFDFGILDETTPFIVMELLKGETLAERLARKGRLTPAQSGRVVDQVAKVLTEAHAMQIVHRDIKPANLFLVRTGEPSDDELFVKVLDFGVAKTVATSAEVSITASGAIVGTPAYMSPEQLRGEKDTDHHADLWGLSAVAYECLTGGLPFVSSTLGELILTIHSSHPAAPSEKVRGLPAEVDAFFANALNRNRQKRFGSALELSTAYTKALSLISAEEQVPSTAVVTTEKRRKRGIALADTESADSPSLPPPEQDIVESPSVSVGSSAGQDTMRSEPPGPPPESRPPPAAKDELPAGSPGKPGEGSITTTTGTFRGAAGSARPPRRSRSLAFVAIALVGVGATVFVLSTKSFVVSSGRPTTATSPAPEPSLSGAPTTAPPVASPIASDSAPASSTPATTVSAEPPSPSASVVATTTPPAVRAVAPPVTASTRAKPSYCTTGAGFVTNEKGFLVPRPECL